jgi:hypothetical protein
VTDDRAETQGIGRISCGVCGGAIFYNPLAPPPAWGSSCLACTDWAVKTIVKLHKREVAYGRTADSQG